MVHAFAIELLWLFARPEERHGSRVPRLQSPLLLEQATDVSTKVIWCVPITLGPYSSFNLCAPRPYISPMLDLIALLPSPTSPSPAQTPFTALTISMARLIMHLHVCIAFFRFPSVNLGHIASRFLIASLPDDV